MFPKPFSVTLETPSISTVTATNYLKTEARVTWGLTTASNVVMEVYRDNVLLNTVSSGTQYYNDSGLVNGIPYQYKIRQYDTQLLVYSEFSTIFNYTPDYVISYGATPDYANDTWGIYVEVPNYPEPYYVKQAAGTASSCGESYNLGGIAPYPITNNVYPTGTYAGPATIVLPSAYNLVFAPSAYRSIFFCWLEARKTSDNSLIATGTISMGSSYAA